MNEEFSSHGLSIVAVTSESERDTEPWIKSKGAEYAYAYDKSGKLAASLGVRGIPNAVLINPAGTIVWQGHPASLTAKEIKLALDGAIELPLYEWGKSAKSIKKAFLKGNLAKAISGANKLAKSDPKGSKIASSLRNMVEIRVASLESALRNGDVHKAHSGAKAFAMGIKGLPAEARVQALLDQVANDSTLQKARLAQAKLADIMGNELSKKKDFDASIKKLNKLKNGFEGSRTAELIENAIEGLRKAKGLLRR